MKFHTYIYVFSSFIFFMLENVCSKLKKKLLLKGNYTCEYRREEKKYYLS